jgi:hypothetical protein
MLQMAIGASLDRLSQDHCAPTVLMEEEAGQTNLALSRPCDAYAFVHESHSVDSREHGIAACQSEEIKAVEKAFGTASGWDAVA